jgi:hypothetical protein
MPESKWVIPTVEPEPEWLTPLGQRDLTGIEDNDTEEVWKALCAEARQTTRRGWRDVEKEYDSLHDPEAKAQWVWRQVELRCRRPGGMYFFGRYCCRLTRLLRRVHDRQMGRRFENVPGTNNRTFLLCHRDSYKSTVAGEVQPLWVLGVRPWERILLSGASDGDTSELLLAIEAFIDGEPRVTATFPYLQPYIDPRRRMAKKWSEKAMRTVGYYLRVGGRFVKPPGREESIRVVGAERSPTRLHPTLWIFDDLINLTNSKSAYTVASVMAFFREVMGNLGAGRMPVSGSGTMWRSDDLAAKILTGEIGNFDVFKMPVREQKDDGSFVYNMPRKEVLAQLSKDEEQDAHCGFDDETFAAVCDILTPYEVACQYHCDPSQREDTSLDPSWWRTYNIEASGGGGKGDMIRPPWNHLGEGEEAEAMWTDAMEIVACIDVAVAETRGANFTACLVLGIDEHGRVWVLDAYYDKMGIPFTHEMLFQLYLPASDDAKEYWRPRPIGQNSPVAEAGQAQTAWRPRAIAIEKVGYSVALQSGLQPRELDEGFHFIWEEVAVTRMDNSGKRGRIIHALAPSFKRGLIRVRDQMWKATHHHRGEVDVTHLLHEEYKNIEDEGHDVDGLDALSAATVFFPMRGRRAKVLSNEDVRDAAERSMMEKMLNGVLRTAGKEDVAEFRVNEGEFLPDFYRRQDDMRIDFDPNRW